MQIQNTALILRAALAAVAAAFCVPTLANAESPLPKLVLSVEEDWELVMKAPDKESTAPQITTALGPARADHLLATFEINHYSHPQFVPGGLQLLLWKHGGFLASSRSNKYGRLEVNGEKITWTQVMRLKQGQLTIAIVNGRSKTWGCFGQEKSQFDASADDRQAGLRISVPMGLVTLNDYSPDSSVKNAGIGYAAHRVRSLALVRVRYGTGDGTVVTDDKRRVVYCGE